MFSRFLVLALLACFPVVACGQITPPIVPILTGTYQIEDQNEVPITGAEIEFGPTTGPLNVGTMTVFVNGTERVGESGSYFWDGEQFVWWNNNGNNGRIRWNDRVGKWQSIVAEGPYAGTIRFLAP